MSRRCAADEPVAPRTRRAAGALPALVGLAAMAGCAGGGRPHTVAGIAAVTSPDGVQLLEDGRPVLFYRSVPEPGREPWRRHYVHPLYSVEGAVVTEDAPADHLHHRGVFWAWRRILVDGVRVADSWVGDHFDLALEPPRVERLPDGSARIDVRGQWLVPLAGQPTPIIEEYSTIRAWPAAGGHRRVEVEVRLRALRDGVAIAGTDDEKGYGGLSARFAHPTQVEIRSDGKVLHATNASMATGAVVQFDWPGLAPPWPARIAAACRAEGRPWTRWVLRQQEPSMQNCAFPGATPVAVPAGSALELGLVLDLD